MDRPEVLLKVATSLDGYLNDSSETRRVFSSAEDQAKVDRLRAEQDAILVGAGTIRADNPRLVIRSKNYRAFREEKGQPADPIKVTITESGDLSPDYQFFQTGENEKLVFAPEAVSEELKGKLKDLAEVIPCEGEEVNLENLLEELSSRSVKKLMVEVAVKLSHSF